MFFRIFGFIGAMLISSSIFTSANAAVITVQPTSNTVSVGNTLEVAIIVSDLGTASAPSIGVFDLNLTFDPAILSFVSSAFGNQLDLFSLGSDQLIDDSIAGVVNAFELSFDLATDLDTLQTPSFTLVTFTFQALTEGSTALIVAFNALGDSLGNPIQITGINNESINVAMIGNSEVPLPAAAWFMISGIGIYVARSRSKTSQAAANR